MKMRSVVSSVPASSPDDASEAKLAALKDDLSAEKQRVMDHIRARQLLRTEDSMHNETFATNAAWQNDVGQSCTTYKEWFGDETESWLRSGCKPQTRGYAKGIAKKDKDIFHCNTMNNRVPDLGKQ